MKRPLLQVGLLYAGGILAAELISVPVLVLVCSALGLAAITLFWSRARPLCLAALALLAGTTNLTLHTAILSPNDLRAILGQQPELGTIRGLLTETPTIRVYQQDEQPSWRTQTRIAVSRVSIGKQPWRPATGILAVSTPGALTNLFAGQEVEVSGVIAPPKAAVAEGTFDYRAYLGQQGIFFQLQAGSEEDWKIVHSPAKAPLADRFRTWARQALARGLPAEDESLRLEWALTLGWKPALTEEVSEAFVQAATYHIFAVDGLRMAIIFGIFFGLFRVLGLSRPVAGVVLVPLIWFYVALTGWPASAIRATVMLTIVIGGWVLNRPTDLLNSLWAAALMILSWQPQQLFQAGFQLSFVVVLCLILMLPKLWEIVRRLTAPEPFVPAQLRRHWPAWVRLPARYVGDVSLTSFAAWVASIPLVAYYFNIVTPVSTPANLLAVPLCGLVLISNLSSLLLAGWFPAAAELFNHAGWFSMECIRSSSHWFAGWPHAYFYVAAPSLFTSALYYSILLGHLTGWLTHPAFRVCKLAALPAVLLVWAAIEWRDFSVTRLTILPVNGGAVAYFDGPGKEDDLLIDCGATNSAQLMIKPFLRAQGLNSLSGLMLTHGDIRHTGGAAIIGDVFTVKQVYVSPVRFRSGAYRRCVEHFEQTTNLVRRLIRNDRIGRWQILHPDTADHFPKADDNALVLRGGVERFRILLLSDLGRAGQEALSQRTLDLRADVVVAGLPSEGEPLRDWLLDAIKPRVIIICDSEFPASERASPKLRERLAGCCARVIYTRSAGAVTIEFRRGECQVRTR